MCNIKHRNSWGIESENLGKGKGKGEGRDEGRSGRAVVYEFLSRNPCS